MNTAAFSSPLEHRIERLICGLAGVVSARAVAEQGSNTIAEIHVLATEWLHPKQIVRNVESALSAGLNIHVDRRVISVAQIRGDTSSDGPFGEHAGGLGGAAAEASEVPDPALERVVFVRFD